MELRPRQMPVKGRFLYGIALISLSSLASGCGVYLHDAELKEATAEAKASFDGLAAPAFFATQRQNLRDAAAREDAAVAAYAASLRNEAVLSFLRPGGRTNPEIDPVARLRSQVRNDLQQTYSPGPWSDEELRGLQTAEYRITENAQLRAALLSDIQALVQRFTIVRAAGDARPTDCAPPQMDVPRDRDRNPEPIAENATEADQIYYALLLQCAAWRDARDFVTQNRPDRFDITDLFANARGQIQTVREQIKASEDQRALDAAAAGELQAHIRRALRGENSGPGTTEQQVNDAIAAATRILVHGPALARRAGLQTLARTIEDLLMAEMGTAAAPSAPTGQEAPATAAVTATEPAVPASEPAVPTTASAASQDGNRTERAAAVLAMLRTGSRTIDEFTSGPNIERAGALLIGLAKVRHDLNMAKADIALQERQRQLLEAQLAALLRRASHLARAHQILAMHSISAAGGFADVPSMTDPEQRTAASEALAAYVRSWDSGEIPYDLLRFRAIQARRMSALERAAVTEQDYRALLQPAVDALAAYGEGGITAETILTVLSRLGIAGSILEN
jgi:hypothetical protein